MSTLMYSSSKDNVMTRPQLLQLPTPAPKGRFHQPYSFGSYADEVSDQLERENIQVLSEEYCVRKDNQQMFGVMEIGPSEGEFISADDWKVLLGLRGSHDQSIPRGLCIGTSVLVCSNLHFSGNLATITTKQTLNMGMRLPQMIRDAVAQIPEAARGMEIRFSGYKNFSLKQRWGDAALVELHRRGALAAPQLGKAIAEWDSPSHAAHAEQGWSAWRLFNACTEALKPGGESVNMNLIADRSTKVSTFIDDMIGL
jgi:hypothetical protein